MSPEFIDIKIAPYALVDTILALYDSNVYMYAITKEDNDLHIRINAKYLHSLDIMAECEKYNLTSKA